MRQAVAGIPIEQVESRLNSIRCPICKGNDFFIDSRSIQSDGDCRAMCQQCRYTFPVHTDMQFYLTTQPDVRYRLKEIACPSCEHRGVDLDFRATLSVRDSYYFLTCPACRHQFPEKSSLEAFE